MYHAVVPEISLGHGLMPWRAGLLRGGEYQHQQYTTNEQAEAPYDTRHWQCTAHPLDEAAPHRPLAECEQGSTTAIATFDEEIVVHMGLADDSLFTQASISPSKLSSWSGKTMDCSSIVSSR